MRRRSAFSVLRWMSIALIALSVVVLILQLVRFSRLWANLPVGLSMGGVPVGMLDRQQAAQRLLAVYSSPVELHYQDSVLQISPNAAGFEIDLESMLAAAELERTRTPFWSAFWNYLWDRTPTPINIPLVSSISEERLRAFLANEVAIRYDQPPAAAAPVVGTVSFQAGSQGTTLDIDRSVTLIDNALKSLRQRVVELPLQRTNPSRPTFTNLEVLLKQTALDLNDYNGVIGLYLADLQSGQEISFFFNQKNPLTSPPDVAFTASSTIKIPIMISAFRRLGDDSLENKPMTAEVSRNLESMIGQSNNPASDWIMQNVIDRVRGPLVVSEDMTVLGLEDTFLAGYFAAGSPLLYRFSTPANQRADVSTDPDPYSQTTPVEVGQLLVDLYQCSDSNGGTLLAAFPGQITQDECQLMVDTLKNDHSPWLIMAGVPDGVAVAHKHGWVSDALGIIHDMSDAAIVYTPGGNYVLTVFLYHPTQLVFDSANKMIVDLSRAVYNFYNLPSP